MFVDEVLANTLSCLSCASCLKEPASMFYWFGSYKHAMREEADDADCQAENQPVSIAERDKVH